MGSGKGKSRRTSGLKPAVKAQRTPFNEITWNDFVEDGGLKNFNLYKYYDVVDELGEPRQQPTGADYEKVIWELFADAVAVGAIILPDTLAASDFIFAIKTISSGRVTYGQDMRVSLKGKPEVSTSIGSIYNTLDGKKVMSNWYVVYVADHINRCIRDLFGKE
jgi:hypothetical protein